MLSLPSHPCIYIFLYKIGMSTLGICIVTPDDDLTLFLEMNHDIVHLDIEYLHTDKTLNDPKGKIFYVLKVSI